MVLPLLAAVAATIAIVLLMVKARQRYVQSTSSDTATALPLGKPVEKAVELGPPLLPQRPSALRASSGSSVAFTHGTIAETGVPTEVLHHSMSRATMNPINVLDSMDNLTPHSTDLI